jgi:peptidoglycan/LPS O-acetylase OafA/YrhL
MTDRSVLESLYARVSRKQIPGLDGVRMIAVFLVILYHFGFSFVPGGHGVMIFFVLSGFLITWLLLEEQANSGTVSLRNFYWRRTLRIFPAFYAFWFAIIAIVVLRDHGRPSAHAWSAFFYVSNYYSALHHHPVNAFSHTWSLGIEEWFYLIWPIVFLLCRSNLRLMTRVLVAVIACVAIHRALLSYVFAVDESYIYSAFDTRVDQLMAGCLLAVLLKRRALEWFWARVCSHPIAPLVTIALVIASMMLGRVLGAHSRDVFGFAVQPILYAVFLAQVITLSGTPMWSWLDAAPIRYLGRISYPLYLYQEVTLYPVRRLLAAYSVPLQLVVAIAVTIVVASLSYYIVERPFLRLRHRPAPLQRLGQGVATA